MSEAPRPAPLVLSDAARAVAAIANDGRSADAALARYAEVGPRGAAVRAVTLGAVRWYLQLEPLVAALLTHARLAPVLRSLLVATLFQLEHSRHPHEALVSSAVEAARLLHQPRAAGLINAVLRRYLRERETLRAKVLRGEAIVTAHPSWLLEALRRAWPQHWRVMLEANNIPGPMTLRVDLARVSLERYREALSEQGLGATPIPWLPAALVLEQPVAVAALPGFEEGWVSVQDAAAQLSSRLLEPRAGERVLDACAAPGGKTAALLEAGDGAIEVTAVDIDATRLERVSATLRRLRRSARLVRADLRTELEWWDGQPFDRILLDAPCSGSGVIRRHPDIKLLRRAADVAALASSQRQLLGQCLKLLKPGGRLLYCTCSVLPEENQQVVDAVVADATHGAQYSPPPAPVARPVDEIALGLGALQLLPGNAALTDGFYYACLTKA
jgi:16S rRNA (cytosine967-C5)-methyltransferase